jgi:pimeloyl-ACP methyl ester carboxylesterase
VDGLPFLPALFDAAATAEEAKTNAGQLRTMYASFKPDQMENMSRMSLAQMITEPKYVDVVAKWASHSDSAFVGQALYDLMTTDLRAELGKLRTPVLLIGAAKATASNPEKLAELRAKYEKQVEKAPDHKVVLASNALHFIMFDDPEFLLQALDEFLGAR